MPSSRSDRLSPLPRPLPAGQVPPAQVPGLSGLLGLAIGVVVIAGLYLGKDVLVPITLAILLSFVLSPVVELLRNWRAPKGVAVFAAVLVALGLVGGVGTIVGMQAASLADDAPAYARTLIGKVDAAKAFAADQVAALQEQATPPRPLALPTPQATTPVTTSLPLDRREPVPVRVTGSETSPLAIAAEYLAPVFAPFETFIIVLVVAIFILMQKEDLRDRVIRVFGSADLHRTTVAMDDAGGRLSRYFLSQLGVNASFGTVIGIGLWLLGMPVPALFGILAGMLRFVPYIGALLGAALPLALAAAVDPGWSMVIYVAILFAVVEPVAGYVVEPMLYGHSAGLSPLSVVVAAVFWTWIWGPVGLVLSMPLTLCLVVLGRHVPSLEFVDILLGDRPALTPVESFYQRMLAHDPAEAVEQAEPLLAERSLAAYYDEVALAGLRLAAADVRRGALDARAARRIVEAMQTVTEELEDHRDVAGTPPPLPAASPWREPGSVLCIAGRGSLDEGVTATVAQLFARQGFGVRRVAHEAASRSAVGTLDLAGARLIYVAYLDLAGSPAHLRYLVRRLKERAPQVPVMVGLWAPGEAVLSDADIQRAIGADHFAGSLEDAIGEARELADASMDPVPA